MSKQMPRHDGQLYQAAALPYRNGKICLITTSSGQGIIIPKGKIPDGLHPSALAAQEAWEEAGLIGRIERKRFGYYSFVKEGKEYKVQVYVLEVTKWASSWPEQQHRKRIWCSVENAVKKVSHSGLRPLLHQLKKRYRQSKSTSIRSNGTKAA